MSFGQVLSTQLQTQAEQVEALLHEISLVSRVGSPQGLETLTTRGLQLKESISVIKELISQKRQQVESINLKVIDDECKTFSQWFQDLQDSVKRTSQMLERREEMEEALKQLSVALADQDGEQQLGQLRVLEVEFGDQAVQWSCQEQPAPLSAWLQTQEEQLATFKAQCHNRQLELKTSLHLLDSEHLDTFAGLLVSVQECGLLDKSLLGDSEALLQQYHELQGHLCGQAETQKQLFHALAKSTLNWISGLRQQARSLGRGFRGTQAQIEKRLQVSKEILNSRTKGDAKLQALRQAGERLLGQQSLMDSERHNVLEMVHKAEQQWDAVMQSVMELHRLLQGVVERAASCHHQKQQTQSRVKELQVQMAQFPFQFPWPGEGERSQAVIWAQKLMEQARALIPIVSGLHTQCKELAQLTGDPYWCDQSWSNLESHVVSLVKDIEVSLSLNLPHILLPKVVQNSIRVVEYITVDIA
ncbi:nesprin-2 [Arapaima gigas]